MREQIESLAADVADAEHVIALTGAGVSTASGIPDFRGDDGIWEEFDPSEFHYSRFKSDPAGFWELRREMHDSVYEGADIEPNAAHEALATLESAGILDTLVTQNVDGLHVAAGSESIVELHGSGDRVVCETCGDRFPAEPVHDRVAAGERPPTCEHCEGLLKPDVVLFGERLPMGELQTARDAARQSAVFLAVGSSLTVEPAASLPRMAHRNGATLAVVNLESTPVSGIAEYDIRADVTEALPALTDELEADE